MVYIRLSDVISFLRVLPLEAQDVYLPLFGVINCGRPSSTKTPKIPIPGVYTLYNPLLSGSERVDITPVIRLLYDNGERILQM